MRPSRRVGLWAFALVTVTLLGIVGCPSVPDPWEERPGKRVLTTFAPLYCFAQNIAGPDANVKIVTAESGPHGFNPSPRDVMLVKRADLFVINGLELDNSIAQRMIQGARNKSVRLVEAASAVPKKDLREAEAEHDEDDDGHDHHHGRYDPHIWLGIPEAVKMVGKIRDELSAIDPDHAGGYESRAKEYIAKLGKIASDGHEMLKDKKERRLIAFHDSLYYFARAFNLEIADSIEIAPGVEPTPRKIQQLIQTCQKHHLRIIAVEPQYPSNTSAQVLLNELKQKGIDAVFVEIDPLETARLADLTPDFYERKMRENLQNLADAMK